ncbi:MAG: SUMF1/EgtB/PvdO family nonheme iron enzyme [Pseudomonadota bacterium]|jgi:formylglycine-generating enzyme required for sulfatase activity|nr:SUMF1/EgtB/PvdO family nonheme iron enzyme [Pseudomonadota bacterium]
MCAAATVTKSNLPRLSRSVLGSVVIGLVAAAAVGAVLWQPRPDPTALPEMAAAAVVLPDGRAIYAQRHEVTISEWNRCADAGACDLTLRPRRSQDPDITPATGLSYLDVQQYLQWINRTTGRSFRLPTSTEWDVMAAAVLPEQSDPLFSDPSLTWASTYLIEGMAPRALKPQGSFSTSPEGIVDLDGSVWEWTEECYAGSAGSTDPDRCPAYFVGGEHVAAIPYLVRDPARGGCAVGSPPAHLGMRLISDEAL